MIQVCPNCNAEIKESMLSSNMLIPKNKTDTINKLLDSSVKDYCQKCIKTIKEVAKGELQKKVETNKKNLRNSLNSVPIVTSQDPQKWDYDTLGIVTGQSTTGTGFISELKSDITDFFGLQSRSYNKKIRSGEQVCYSQIRQETLELGGNAIIAVDIDYSEAGSLKGMLMVCVSGTAVKVNNFSELDTNLNAQITKAIQAQQNLTFLQKADSELMLAY